MNFKSPFKWFSKKLQRREMAKKGLVQPKKKKRLNENNQSWKKNAESSKLLAAVILLSVWAVSVTVVLLLSFSEPVPSLQINQIAPDTVYSNFSFSYDDMKSTEQKKSEALKNMPLIYTIDSGVTRECVNETQKLIDFLKIKQPQKDSSENLVKNTPNYLKKLTPEEIGALKIILRDGKAENSFINAVKTAMYAGVIESTDKFRHADMFLRIYKENIKQKPRSFTEIPDTEEAAERISKAVSHEFSPANRKNFKNALKKTLIYLIRNNLAYASEKTDAEKNKLVNSIRAIKTPVKKGEIIVKKGIKVDHDILAKYSAYMKEFTKKRCEKDFYKKLFSSALISFIIICLACLYINHFYPGVLINNHKMGLIGVAIVASMIVNYFTAYYFYKLSSVFNLHPILLPVIIPIAMAPIILSPMLGLRIAHFTGLFVAVIAAMQFDNSFSVLINSVIICSVSAYFVRHRPNHPAYFISAAFIIGLCTTFLSLVHLFLVADNFSLMYKIAILGFVNGIITAIMSLCLLFILEIIFQISTDMTLLLLCDYNHLLLKRLQLEAPGTYHHSLVVSTLAEQAAKAIGANPVKARVIAIFHDIGKMVKPEYFTENNPDASKKHNRLSPRMSSLIILNHVKDGTDLAIKSKLRKIIRDGIQQHHGTDIVYSFYRQALDESREKLTSVDENDFRYPGPLPKEKEVVILSLADPVEAASRSMQKPTPSKIDALVWEIMRKRIRNGQLDEADLTFGELKKIKESFVSTLTTMMHVRVAYPKDEEEIEDEGDLFMASKKITPSEE